MSVTGSPIKIAADVANLNEVTVTTSNNGDLIIGIPGDQALKAEYLVQTHGGCPSSAKRDSCNNYDVAGGLAVQFVEQMGVGGMFQDLIMPIHISLGTLIAPLLRQLPQVQRAARNVPRLARTPALVIFVATFWLLYSYVVDTTPVLDPTHVTIPASDFATSQQPQATGSKECPFYIPNCSNCGGKMELSLSCVGVTTPKAVNFAAGCPCVDPGKAPVSEEDPQAIMKAQDFLAALTVLATSTMTAEPLATSQVQSSGRYALYFEQSLGVKGTTIGPSVAWTVADWPGNSLAFDVTNSEYFTVPISPGTSLLVQWTGDPTSESAGLKFLFTDWFGATFAWGDTSPQPSPEYFKFKCLPPSKYTALGGSDAGPTRVLKCFLKVWPSAADDKYRIEMTQSMIATFFSVQYTLYTATLDEQISNKSVPLKTRVAEGVQLPWDPLQNGVEISIYHTTKKDSVITFNRNGNSWLSSGAVRRRIYSDPINPGSNNPEAAAPSSDYYCDQTEANNWSPIGSGFTRTFSCYFLG